MKWSKEIEDYFKDKWGENNDWKTQEELWEEEFIKKQKLDDKNCTWSIDSKNEVLPSSEEDIYEYVEWVKEKFKKSIDPKNDSVKWINKKESDKDEVYYTNLYKLLPDIIKINIKNLVWYQWFKSTRKIKITEDDYEFFLHKQRSWEMDKLNSSQWIIFTESDKLFIKKTYWVSINDDDEFIVFTEE